MLLLEVAFEEKDTVKQLGAKWQPQFKKWCVKDVKDYPKFSKWIKAQGDIVILGDFYLLTTDYNCQKCQQPLEVIAFGLKQYWIVGTEAPINVTNQIHEGVHLLSTMHPLSYELKRYIQKNFHYRLGVSKDSNKSGLRNFCPHCQKVQDDNALFFDENSPFVSWQRGKVINGIKIPISEHFVIKTAQQSIGQTTIGLNHVMMLPEN